MNHNLLEGTFNFRDLGGYLSQDGLKVKRNLIYRSDALTKLTKDDVMLIHDLAIKTIVDLRQPHEIDSNPNVVLEGIATVNLSPVAVLAELSTGSANSSKQKVKALIEAEKDEMKWAEIFQNGEAMGTQMEQMAFDPYSLSIFKQIFDKMMDLNQVPLVFHCKGGKDRTGLMSALFLMALGVSKKQIIEDYMLTKEYMRDRNIRRIKEYESMISNRRVLDFLASIMDTKESYIHRVFDAIESKYNSYEDYLKNEVGLSQNEIAQLQTLYLDRGID